MARIAFLVAVVSALAMAQPGPDPAYEGGMGMDMGEDMSGPPWITVEQLIPGATREDAVHHLRNTTFDHPFTGPFTLRFVFDEDPTNTQFSWYDENDTLVSEVPDEYDIEAPEFPSEGWFTIAERVVGGTLLTPWNDWGFEGEWQEEGLLLRLTAPDPAEQRGPRTI